jgi:hypothetical protein
MLRMLSWKDSRLWCMCFLCGIQEHALLQAKCSVHFLMLARHCKAHGVTHQFARLCAAVAAFYYSSDCNHHGRLVSLPQQLTLMESLHLQLS